MKTNYAKNDKYAVTLKPDIIDRVDRISEKQLRDRATMNRVLILKGLEYFEKTKGV